MYFVFNIGLGNTKTPPFTRAQCDGRTCHLVQSYLESAKKPHVTQFLSTYSKLNGGNTIGLSKSCGHL